VSNASTPADGQQSAPIDLGRVRRLFSSPGRIADSDFLRREVAGRMHERLGLVKIAPARVLDAGCGDGRDLHLLQGRYPGAHVLGIDAAPAMAAAAAAAQSHGASAMTRLLSKLLPAGGRSPAAASVACADFAQLPLGTQSIDLVWSNLALHWHPQPDRVFAEWRRVLAVDGLLMFSCFGPDTFRELRTAFAAADRDAHALSFVDMHDFGDMLVNVGFATPVMDMETITVTYDDPARLLREVRAWGGNPLMTRRAGLMGRAAWRRVHDALDGMRRGDGRIPLTYEVVYGHAFRPVPKTTAAGEAIVRLDFGKRK